MHYEQEWSPAQFPGVSSSHSEALEAIMPEKNTGGHAIPRIGQLSK
jgi:hypothetical protein